MIPDSLGASALRREFARQLVSMRGVPMKMSQVLAMSGGGPMADLQREALASVPAASTESVRKRLRACAPRLYARLGELSDPGLAASLGQVHRARLTDGRDCALKVKHAGIGPAMDLDAGLMELLTSVFGAFRKGFALDAYRALLAGELRGELDYPGEAARQARLHSAFAGAHGIVIPRAYPEESGPEHILMDWEASEPIERFARGATGPERAEAAGLLGEFHFRTLFGLRGLPAVHADPNPGNFGLRRGVRGVELVVYDFGSLVELDAPLTRGLARLLGAAQRRADPYDCLLEMGFLPEPLGPIRARLAQLCSLLCEPLSGDGPFDFSRWRRRERVEALLGPERWNFMIAAPPPLFFVLRALQGIFLYSGYLGVSAAKDWCERAGKRAEDFPPQKSQVKNGKSGDVDHAINSHASATSGKAARHLRIEVRKLQDTVVSLTLPADCAYRLEDFIEPGLAERLRARGISIASVVGTVERLGLVPMPLFRWSEDGSEVHIRLE
ncbi:MAG TPA: AarF/UbiB family protein [Fibrobacteria bacterium]|nr:AarF/UbiB family protein [Fibrobacteria bacterium]